MKGLGLVLDLPALGMGPGLATISETEFAVNSICWLSD